MAIRVREEKQMRKVFIIAEAGVNHNGSIEIAKKMINAAVNAGADAVKFQSFNPELLVSRYAPKARYQEIATGNRETHLEMIKKLWLGLGAHKILFRYCRSRNIIFLSSPFDLESIDLLSSLNLKIFKIPSGEITNLPYLRRLSSLRKKIILSTGMAKLSEVKDAIDVLMGGGTARKDITALHCNTEYPTCFDDVNLLAMVTLKNELKVNVGYSDHTPGIEIPIAAVALGASIIEKHFTLDRNMSGPDHLASLEPSELKAMVLAVRNLEKALGDGVKRPSKSEIRNISIIRKSIVAARDIKKGERFSGVNITVKRPGIGLSPMLWDKVLDKVAVRNFRKDRIIKL